MKKFFEQFRGAALALAVAAIALLPFSGGVKAQVVTKLPLAVIANGGAVTDLGNGPAELLVAQGSVQLFTSSGSGVGSTSGSSTTLTLTATPAVPPIVGGIISGAGITSGTTVAAYNGTTTITLSAAMTVAASTPLAWGAACPAAIGASFPVLNVQAPSVGLPFFTQARLCAASQFAAGGLVLPFSIGAH